MHLKRGSAIFNGTTSVVPVRQQVQRVCLEKAVPGLINAIVENANHHEDGFLQDPDIMVVYLEQLVRFRTSQICRFGC